MANIIEITDLSIPALDVYTHLTGRQLKSRRDPHKGLFIAESHKVISHALDAGYEPVSFLMERRQLDGVSGQLLRRCPEVPVYTAPREVLAALTGYELTRGVLCAMHRPAPLTAETACASAKRVAILEGIVDPTNVGAIFRSAAALGMDAVLITPSCCDPLHRRAVRVSMGTVFQLPWAVIGPPGSWPAGALDRLHAMGFSSAALALTDASLPIDHPDLARCERLALILGTEGDGLSPDTIARCRYTLRIPMSNGVDSLNVGAAAAVAFWQLRPHTPD